MTDQFKVIDGTKMKLVDNGDGSFSWSVAATISGGSGGSGPDYELAISRYRATTAGTGYSVGDSITSIRTMLVTSTGSTQAGDTLWYNDTTQANLASAPPAGNLQDIATTGITNAQMAALLSGMATAALQTSGNASLTTLATPIVASGAADAGGSMKLGGVARAITTTPAATTAGNRVEATFNVYGDQRVVIMTAGGDNADGRPSTGGVSFRQESSASATGALEVRPYAFNGTTWDRVRGSVNGAWQQGNVASGVADAGNPIKTGGKFTSGGVTLATGQRGDTQMDAAGNTLVRAGGITAMSTLSPTVTAVTYTAGQGVGGLLTFANAMRLNVNSGIVQSVQAAIAASVTGSFDLFLFNANPSASTVGNAATFAVAAADAPKLLGVVHLTDVTAMGAAFTLFQALGQAIPCATAARDLFAVLVARSSITMPSTSALTVNLNIMQD